MTRIKALFIAIAMQFLIVTIVSAGTITVDSVADEVAVNGECTLREAMIAAGFDVSFSDCAYVGATGDDFINFDPDLWITSFIAIQLIEGPLTQVGGDAVSLVPPSGLTVIVDGNGADPVFELDQNPGSVFNITRFWIREGNSLTNGGGHQGIGWNQLPGNQLQPILQQSCQPGRWRNRTFI